MKVQKYRGVNALALVRIIVGLLILNHGLMLFNTEKMQEFTKELFAPENKKKYTLLLMLCGNLAPLLVAEIMAVYPATVIDGTVFFEQVGFYFA